MVMPDFDFVSNTVSASSFTVARLHKLKMVPPPPPPAPKTFRPGYRPTLGIEVIWTNDGKGGVDNVCYVEGLKEGGPGEQVGIEVGDVIRKWGNEPLDSKEKMSQLFKTLTDPDGTVELLIVRHDLEERKDRELTFVVPVGSTNAAKSKKTITAAKSLRDLRSDTIQRKKSGIPGSPTSPAS